MATAETENTVDKEKSIPKDGQVMISILKDMCITEYEPRVINQMLEFSYR
jgi:transcription initiation factor TFIID subunit 9B